MQDITDKYKPQLNASAPKNWMADIGKISNTPKLPMSKSTDSFLGGLKSGAGKFMGKAGDEMKWLGQDVGDFAKGAGLTSTGGIAGVGEMAYGITDSLIKQPDMMGVEDQVVSGLAKGAWKVAGLAPNPYTVGAAAVLSGFDLANNIFGDNLNSDGTQDMTNTGYANFSADDLLKEGGKGKKGTLLSKWFHKGRTKAQNARIDFGKKANLLASDVSYQNKQNAIASQNTTGVLQDKTDWQLRGGANTRMLAARMGTKIPPVNLRNIANKAEWNKKKKLEEQKKKLEASKVLEKDTKYKDGGLLSKSDKEEIIEEVTEEKTNVIPEGAFHSRKNNIHEDYAEHVTKKGIPVITKDEEGKVTQHAEVERNEIIFHKEATDTMETLYEKFKKADTQKIKDEIMIECGKYIADQILVNTDDRTGIIETIE